MHEDGPTDAELVEAALSGTDAARDAYRQLVLRHQSWLIRYLRHILGDPGLADDVGQEAFLKAWQDLPRLRNHTQFKAWLRKIASRTAFNHRRGSKRRAHYEAQSDAPSGLASPDGRLEAEDILIAVLEVLPYPYREIIVLRHVEDLSVKELAATLMIGESAAKMRLARARQAFYEHYDHLTEQPDEPT